MKRVYTNHRKIVEKEIGRRLKKNEVIHHKDGNTRNNDISNLEIMKKEEHDILHKKGKNALYKFRRKQKLK